MVEKKIKGLKTVKSIEYDSVRSDRMEVQAADIKLFRDMTNNEKKENKK
jgi:hypothetical protein